MKAVILAGGLGTRLSEETSILPKPLVEIGGKPILWHIMKIYSAYGVNDFIICLGHKGYLFKEYFASYALRMSDVTVDTRKGSVEYHNEVPERWRVTLVDTGANSGTGGRLKRVLPLLADEEAFHFTYGDGLAALDIRKLEEFHKSHYCLGTVTATRPPKRFGLMKLDGHLVTAFEEKPDLDGGWVNGGFFVLSPKVGPFIDDDQTYWEAAPIREMVSQGQLQAYIHSGFWHPMDTIRDRETLENYWMSESPPWKVWD
ncbi:MAG: glucose-1-phosphate cytidylyltransferase [Magnetovibrio sp.]|nr:glucose-1-phosphate cytidylyltransferase [Magnetovibrio sp.]